MSFEKCEDQGWTVNYYHLAVSVESLNQYVYNVRNTRDLTVRVTIELPISTKPTFDRRSSNFQPHYIYYRIFL